MRLVDVFWLVVPAFPAGAVHWLDFVAPLAIGGLWLAAFLWQLADRPLVPLNDPAVEEALAHHGT
jgi:hypothetical protein